MAGIIHCAYLLETASVSAQVDIRRESSMPDGRGEASRSRPSCAIDLFCGRPPRYALTHRAGRPGKPTSQGEVGRSPAKRDLDTIFTLFPDALNIWLAFKRTTFNVCTFCMVARTVAALIMSGAFFSRKMLYKSVIRGLPLPPISCARPILRSASALRAHTSSREAGQAHFTR
jgi:hypothetical protein